MKKRTAGLTLLEVLIASAILAVVVGITMNVLFSGTRTAASGQLMSQLEQRGNRDLEFFRDQVSTARFNPAAYVYLGIYPGSNNTAIGYQVFGTPTVPTTGTPTTTFGYVDPRVPVTDTINKPVNTNLSCFVRFEADTVYLESSASLVPTQAVNWVGALAPQPPAYPVLPGSLSQDPSYLVLKVLNMDVNGNGNRTDTFVSGRLMKYVVDITSGAVVGRERLDDQVILAVNGPGAGAFQGDVDGDTIPDYLFCFTNAAGTAIPALTAQTGSGLLINLWHGCLDQDGKRFLLRNNRQLIHFRTELQN
ncbi:MAG TPA: prepilin-type N-terminal cleavage/methylation domain-containing protein [Planctomycetota bacterium]|nr:prepilin-type N-terminal cleavage/methylation domain-containing protein [Planctomycetota bacterium]